MSSIVVRNAALHLIIINKKAVSSESWDCNHVAASMCTIKETACKIFINRCHYVALWLEAGVKLGQSARELLLKNVSRPPLAWGRAQCEIHHVLTKVRPSCQGTMPRSGVWFPWKSEHWHLKKKVKCKCYVIIYHSQLKSVLVASLCKCNDHTLFNTCLFT